MGRDAPTEEKRKQDDATLQIMSIHYSLYKTRNIKKHWSLLDKIRLKYSLNTYFIQTTKDSWLITLLKKCWCKVIKETKGYVEPRGVI